MRLREARLVTVEGYHDGALQRAVRQPVNKGINIVTENNATKKSKHSPGMPKGAT